MSDLEQKVDLLVARQQDIILTLEFIAKSMHHADTALLQMGLAMANGNPEKAVEHSNTLVLIHRDAQDAIKRLKDG
jgi:hypothetical protein